MVTGDIRWQAHDLPADIVGRLVASEKLRFIPGTFPINCEDKAPPSYPYATEDSLARVPIDFTIR